MSSVPAVPSWAIHRGEDTQRIVNARHQALAEAQIGGSVVVVRRRRRRDVGEVGVDEAHPGQRPHLGVTEELRNRAQVLVVEAIAVVHP